MKIEQVTYKGWQHCIKILHEDIELIVTTDVGPRVIHCGFTGGENLFYEDPLQSGTTGGDEWKIYGGHRCWCAPEDETYTYAVDNLPVEVRESGSAISFIAPPEKFGVQKTITIQPSLKKGRVAVNHTVVNTSLRSLLIAPWALSVMRQGGTVILPHDLGYPFQLTPTHSFSLWSYTRIADSRWHWGDRYVFLKQDPTADSSQKIGCQNPYGWAAYSTRNELFVKYFPFDGKAAYPDFNVNFEAWTNKDMLEIETLGPLCTLQPGEATSHQEEWSLFHDIPEPANEADVDKLILPLTTR
mgnify:FL=1